MLQMHTHVRAMLHKNGFTVVGMLLIFLAAVTVYYKGLSGPFLLDDIPAVTGLNVDNLTIESAKDLVFSDRTGPVGRPLTIATFVANKYYAQSEGAYAFKIVNLLLHLICSVLVFIFLRSMFHFALKDNQDLSPNEVNGIALLCTAAWTLHPLQVSTVLYVVQRMAMLSTLFTLLALIAYVGFRRGNPSITRALGYSILCLMLIALAVSSKENGVLILPMLALLELTIFRFKTVGGKNMPRFKLFFIVASILSLAFSIVAAYHVWDSVMMGYISRDYGLLERLLSQAGALLLYLKMILLPSLPDMSLYHDGFPVPEAIDSQVLFRIMAITCIVIVGIVSYHRLPLLSFGIGLFFTAHLLESTILPLEPVFEHRNYLALLGIVVPVFWYGSILVKKAQQKTSLSKATAAILIVPILLLSSQSFVRAFEWSDSSILINQAIREKPQSIRARNIYTGQLEASGSVEEVIEHLRKNRLDIPNRTHFVIQELMFIGIINGLDKDVLQLSHDSLSQNPLFSVDISALHDLLRHALKPEGNWMPIPVIKSLFQTAIENPVKKLKPSAQAILFEQYAIVLRVLKDYESAMNAVEMAISIDSSYLQSRLTRAYLLADMGLYQKSQTELELVRSLDKRNQYLEPIADLQDALSKIEQAEVLH